VSLAMALMVSHLRKANGLVPFGAIWCLCCCTCGSLLAKVNWQNGSVYCSERLVKRPKKNQWFIAAVRISRGLHPCQWLPVSKAKNILKSHVANLSGCTHMGHMGWRQFLYMFFFVFISWYAIMYGYGSNLEYWSDGRLLSFLGWSGINRAKKGRWQLWLFDPYPYMHIYIYAMVKT
jgi:hypothetical protein